MFSSRWNSTIAMSRLLNYQIPQSTYCSSSVPPKLSIKTLNLTIILDLFIFIILPNHFKHTRHRTPLSAVISKQPPPNLKTQNRTRLERREHPLGRQRIKRHGSVTDGRPATLLVPHGVEERRTRRGGLGVPDARLVGDVVAWPAEETRDAGRVLGQ